MINFIILHSLSLSLGIYFYKNIYMKGENEMMTLRHTLEFEERKNMRK